MLFSENEQNNSETVLVVEDNLQTAEYMEVLLGSAGFRCIICTSGIKALDVIRTEHIDLVLQDVLMPDINGITAAQRIKNIAGKEFLPVILVTALCSDEDKVAGLTYADDYITKPFSGEELLARINSLLRIRRLHRELSHSKARYECLYENFPHLYISIDSDRNITECNRFFRTRFKLSREEVIGKSIFSFFKAEDKPLLEHFFSSFVISDLPSVQQRIFSLVSPYQSEPLMINMKAVYMGYEETGLAIVIAMEDVSQQLRLQDEQKNARIQLYRSARLASIGTLASGVAHELNNPLTAILGFSSALLDRVKNNEAIDTAELEQYLSIINTEALRCRDTVENLSKFAREGDFQITRVSLRECINDSMKLTRSKAAKANITLINEIPGSVEVKADTSKIEQVFVNIFSNCIEFCNEHSEIRISQVRGREPTRYYTVQISDNGPGINPEVLPKVFDPFFTTKEVGRGMGMGLAICHKLMKECHGNIDIASEPGRGTTVILDIPLSTEGM